MNWNCDDPDGYCWMPPTPALSPAFGAGSQPEHANVREPWLAPNFIPGQTYMSSASPATIESATAANTVYKYRVKVINPQNKKDFLWINLHGVTKRFISPADLKQQLIESLKDNAPPLSAIDSFHVGYLQKPSQAKHWIISGDDLECMYAQLCGDEVSLWCDKRVVESGDKTARSSGKTKRSASSSEGPPTKRSAKSTNYALREDEIEELASEIRQKHGDSLTYPQYKLWARLIKNGQHKDTENPPDHPMINGKYSKTPKPKDANLTEAVAGAAVAIVKALKGSPDKTESTPTPSAAVGISPGKKVLLSGQYLKQLETIQKLKDDGVLSATEFDKQKDRIMNNLTSLDWHAPHVYSYGLF